MDLLRKNTSSNCTLIFFLLIEILPLWSGRPFSADWINHVWLLEYFADYLGQHHSFPSTIDVSDDFGNSLPLFYGVFFYPLLSLPALSIGGDLTIRLLFTVLLIAPVWTYFLLFKQFTKSHDMAVSLSLILNCSIYQLTNLYVRGALTEIAAYQSIVLGLSLMLLGLLTDRGGGKAQIMAGIACILFGFGTHPITLYMTLLFCLPVMMCCLAIDRRLVEANRLKPVWLLSGVAVVLLLPWFILTVTYKDHFHVFSIHIFANKLIYFPQSIDSFWAKLGLFYIDNRIFEESILNISTPFLDAPLPVLMLVMIMSLLWTARREHPKALLMMTMLVVFLIIGAVALCMTPDSAIPYGRANASYVTGQHGVVYRLLLPLQFIYRLSGAVSLCLVVVLVTHVHLLAGLENHNWREPILERIAMGVIRCAILCTLLKILLVYIQYDLVPYQIKAQSIEVSERMIDARSLLIPTDEYRDMVKRTDRYPFTFYSKRGYAMYGNLTPSDDEDTKTENNEDVQVISVRLSAFDTPIVAVCDRPCLINTNIMPSLLYRVVINGHEAEDVALNISEHLQFRLPQGQHRISVEWLEKRASLLAWSVWGFIVFFLSSMGWLAVSLVPMDGPLSRHWCRVRLWRCG